MDYIKKTALTILMIWGFTGLVYPQPTLKSFPDIESHWAKSAIQTISTLYNLDGYMGYDTFQPELPITRAELSFLFVKIWRLPLVYPSKPSYEDVPKTHWAFSRIEAIATDNLFPKIDNTRFAPNAYVTRMEFMIALLKLLDIKPSLSKNPIAPDLPTFFKDNKWINTAYEQQLFPKTWDTKIGFFPYQLITRAEVYSSLSQTPIVKTTRNRFLHQNNTPKINEPDTQKPLNPIHFTAWCTPNILPIDGTQLLNLHVSIKPINAPINVWADLSEIGRMENCYLQDKGMWNDIKANDGIYSCQVKIAPGIFPGQKMIPFFIANKTGMVTGEFSITVLLIPEYKQQSAEPEEIPPEIKTKN